MSVIIHTDEELSLCCDVVYPECGMCPLLEQCKKVRKVKKVNM